MAELPLVMTPSGLAPIPPADIRARIEASVAQTNPDYTANLPGTLVEDILSTDVAAVVLSNQFLIDLVNSLTPHGANPFLLNLLGQIYGVNPSTVSNTSVYVVFHGGPGYTIDRGFTVSDGTYQYVVMDGGVCGTDGYTLPLYALATQPGAWSVPPGTVNQFITSVPTGYNLTVTNPEPGTPESEPETETGFRSRVLMAGLAASTGMSRYLKTLLGNVPGVQSRLISVRQDLVDGKWVVMVGGGDPYQVAYAIYYALFDVNNLGAPLIRIAGITNNNPAVVTTEFNHNLTTGDVKLIRDVLGMTQINNDEYPVTVMSPTTFSIGVDSTDWGVYTGGGTVSPNPIVNPVSIVDYPDTYVINYIVPVLELVNISVQWATDFPNYVSAASISSLVTPALVDYINSLAAGTTPINIYDMTALFLDTVAPIIPSESITSLNFAVSVNGIGVAPPPGGGVIYGDPNSYFYTDSAHVQILESTR